MPTELGIRYGSLDLALGFMVLDYGEGFASARVDHSHLGVLCPQVDADQLSGGGEEEGGEDQDQYWIDTFKHQIFIKGQRNYT